MRLQVTKTQSNGFVNVGCMYGGETIIWQTPIYGKVCLENPEGIFNDINRYLETLPKESLDVMWECYKGIYQSTMTVSDSYYVAQTIRNLVTKLYSVISLDDVKRWVVVHGNLHYPPDIQDVISSDSRYTDESQTYLRHDYVNIATFTVALRLMIPIWGAYLDLINDNQKGKELESLGLISDTELMDWGVPVSVTDKLSQYIDERIRDKSISMDSTWRGYGSSEIPKIIRAKVIIRRLTIAIIDDPRATSIISSVHWYICYCLNPAARTTADRVADKKISSGNSDDEERNSFIDAHKIKTRVAIGDQVAFEKATEMCDTIARTVDATYDPEKLRLCLDCIRETESSPLSTHQKRLAQWVNSRAIEPKAYPHMDEEHNRILAAIAQSLLWHWGFIDIAILLQVERYVEEGISGTALPIATKSFPRVNAHYKDEINRAYPHMKQQRIPRNPTKNAEKHVNYVQTSINNLTTVIRSGTWVYRGPKALWEVSGQPQGQYIIALPQTIKTLLTDVVLKLADLPD